MKLCSFEVEGKESYGIVDGDRVIDLLPLSSYYNAALPLRVLDGIAKGEEFLQQISSLLQRAKSEGELSGHTLSIEEINWLPPMPEVKRNIICVGKNYREHAIEMGSSDDIPEHIMIFTKATNTVAGHGHTVPLHEDVTSQLDYEGELAVVIGKRGIKISPDDAMDHVFGYTIVNDITARDLQKKHGQFFIGKSLDFSCPIGPYIVTKSEVADPHQLTITTSVNGEVRQSSSTGLMIFRIPDIISTLSQGMTLEPGDIIATGTPAGVGKGFTPPRYLKAGDRIDIEVEGLGNLTNQLQ
ncbi:fumarylacetoacetate hydrolase family protein [Rossellomorea aquimaris]|uniref:fumarylacetoacetate hydrolase family protein n=1 Tax=Rossellomorea aquimaris TaxID=189382 RepID=UPI001CD379E7|nr:fumarylacetoacetate hydrolase family protein [Rossellomorea aquimaris]MCA1056409.1 fumarylacetoacetate hydrolase family protein [Rossellomorea aquimaris]